ncbi:hypothetical protein FO519_006677 [Halicephalobus sp. NKZ332]|nr:hypothetical protein FO519_006677 [Halicephalobus sp. NKZ332]
MIGVPTYMTCSDLIHFVHPCESISEMKIVRDSTPNRYMVILKFKSYRATMAFYARCNGTKFNPLEEDKCNLMFVEKVEITTENSGGSLARENMTELPTCTVCLERLDDSIVTILCNHSFHTECLEQWADTTCPVCRHNQTPEEVDAPTCSNCGKSTDLWMCLICGSLGCGRYVEAHAYRHFETTGHTFTLQVGGNLVWDYAGDNYVHRIIQNAADGKVVEVQPGRNENDKQQDKVDEIQLEYSNMLAQQLEKQRSFFEDKIKAMEESMNNFRDGMVLEMNNLRLELDESKAEVKKLNSNLQSMKSAKENLEKKLNTANSKITKLQQELTEEQQMSEMVRKDKDMLLKQKEDLVWKNNIEIKDLREQLHDVMMHFDAKAKIEGGEMLTEEELQSASVELLQPKEKHQRRKKKK